MAKTYGLTSSGFVVKQQQDIINELVAQFQQVFGQNINVLPESNFGQLIGILSEREALIWQIAEAVYNSQYPAGAEGSSVDNILALNNLRRLPASPTRTSLVPLTQSNGITLYGLVLYGVAGTVIPAGSIIQTGATPPVQFSIDNTVTIESAQNAIQSLFMSNSPTSGAFSLSIEDPSGNTLTTSAIEWNALAGQTKLSISTTPAALSSFQLVLTSAGSALTTGAIATNGVFPTAASIQSAINALSGYSGVTVSGSAGSYTISWGSISNPVTTITGNTTGAIISAVDSVQSAVNNLFDSSTSKYPYTDVVVSVNASGFNFTFGQGTPVAGQPSSASQPEPLMLIVSNTLQMGATVTNLEVVNSQQGTPAQAVASATCTQDGPVSVIAGTLNTIATAITGWNSVINQLDCIPGTNVETDSEALNRQAEDLSAQANGPIQAIVTKVRELSGVVTAIGFQNLNEAALQIVSFPITPGSGSYKLVVNGTPTSTIAYNATSSQVQTAIRTVPGFSNALVTGDNVSGYTVDFNGALGGQPINLMAVSNNTTGGSIVVGFGRPGKSFEIVVQGGDPTDIAQTILAAKPAGIQSYGSSTVQVFDSDGNPYYISFSRPTDVPIYVVLSLVTDLLTAAQPLFNPSTITTIQLDIVSAINAVGIGGLVKGFGSNGIIGAFNDVPGINDYTLYFGRSPNPLTNTPVQMQPEEAPVGESFNVAVSYT